MSYILNTYTVPLYRDLARFSVHPYLPMAEARGFSGDPR